MLFKRFLKKFLKAKYQERKNIIFSGGRSIHSALNFISSIDNNLDDINVHLLDERIIKNENLTNYSLIKKKLKKKYNVLFLNKEKISRYNVAKLKKQLTCSKTITILGMGEDGHFASIFLKSRIFKKLINKNNKPNILMTEKIGHPFCRRLTMNLSMILLSYKIIIYLNNEKKKKLFFKFMRSQNKYSLPIYHLVLNGRKKILVSINEKLFTINQLKNVII
tara:strand:- start:27527 stop:28189 length:663 start_codon:yes stop_codon:yes gene_type:complete